MWWSDIKANHLCSSYGQNIVRLLEVGAHNQPESWIARLLAARDKNAGGVAAERKGYIWCDGITLTGFDLPKTPMGPLFLAPD